MSVIHGCRNCGHDVDHHDGTGPCPLDLCTSFEDYVETTSNPRAEIDVKADAEFDDVKIVVTHAQARMIADTIAWNVDMDTVAYDNDEPERADFLAMLKDAIRKELA